MDNYRTLYPPRIAPRPDPNPLAELAPTVVAWGDLEAYFQDLRERAIRDMTTAETERALWQSQGKLALIDELTHLRAILQTLDSQGKE